jgi:hypothetical protein
VLHIPILRIIITICLFPVVFFPVLTNVQIITVYYRWFPLLKTISSMCQSCSTFFPLINKLGIYSSTYSPLHMHRKHDSSYMLIVPFFICNLSVYSNYVLI